MYQRLRERSWDFHCNFVTGRARRPLSRSHQHHHNHHLPPTHSSSHHENHDWRKEISFYPEPMKSTVECGSSIWSYFMPNPPQTAKKRLALKRRFCIRTLLHIPVTHYCFSLACRWSAGAVELHCELGLEAAQWDDGALTPSPDRSQPTLLTMHTHKIQSVRIIQIQIQIVATMKNQSPTLAMDLQRETQHKDHLGVSVEWRFSGDWVSEGGRPMVCRKGCLSGLDEPEAGYKNMKSNLNMSSSSSSSAWWRSSPLKSLWGDLSGVNYCDWRGQVAWPKSPHTTAYSTISTVHMDTLKTLLQCNTFIDKVWPGGEFQFLQYSQMLAE